ncbi:MULTISPECIES: S1C family serine protease [unclassified Modestobacter]
MVQQLRPSVVTIFASEGLGSGVVYRSDGLIVTNAHVVAGNEQVEIAFADGQRVPGTVEAADPISDLALVRADRQGLPAASFQEDAPQVGAPAIAIGSPLGFENTVTTGIVSGLHRDIPGSAAQGRPPLVGLIQTDAAISPGNSGGALANDAGEVIGINEAHIPPSTGAVSLGFAIPAAVVVDVVEQLRRTGTVDHAFAGLAPATLTEQIADQLGLSRSAGAVVTSVTPGGPADVAGLQPGEVITEADGEPVRTAEDLVAVVRQHEPGDTLELEVLHADGGTDTVQLTLTDRPTTG